MPQTARDHSQDEAVGSRFLLQKGSHRLFVHETQPGVVIVPMHKGDLKIGTEKQILKDAGLS
jgi:predicted RNA binding protein YcfA (HicA-like mRNA interferase family)